MMLNLISSIFLICLCGSSYASIINVFALADQQITNCNEKIVCRIGYDDIAAKIQTQINKSCNSGQCLDKTQIQGHFQAQFKEMSKNYLCAYKAFQLGVKKFPAIVFDKKYVVYGIYDVKQAYLLYQTSLKGAKNNV